MVVVLFKKEKEKKEDKIVRKRKFITLRKKSEIRMAASVVKQDRNT